MRLAVGWHFEGGMLACMWGSAVVLAICLGFTVLLPSGAATRRIPPIWIRLPRTLELIAAAALIALALGVPAGLFAALRRGGKLDVALSWVSAAVLAVPVFLVGTLMVLLFARWAGSPPAAMPRSPRIHCSISSCC